VAERVKDSRQGTGRPTSVVEMPTLRIPSDCLCSWTVATPGPGLNCISRLSYANALCGHRHAAEAASRERGRTGV
jgi:hypothetical protein